MPPACRGSASTRFALQNEILMQSGNVRASTNVTGIACTTPSTGHNRHLQSFDTRLAERRQYVLLRQRRRTRRPRATQILGDYAIDLPRRPQQMASLVEAPLAVEQANFRALDNRMWSSLNAPRTQGKLEAWAAYDYSQRRPAGGAEQRQCAHEHDRGRRRHEGLGPHAGRCDVRLHRQQGRFRRPGRRLYAAPAGRNGVRRLWRWPVVRRRDARRRQPRLLGHHAA